MSLQAAPPPMPTPSPRTDSESNQQENEDADDVFRFDAPAYYDLRNPALEKRYVNNADGYFTPGAYRQLRAHYREPPKDDGLDDREDDAHMSDADDADVDEDEGDESDAHEPPALAPLELDAASDREAMDTDTLSRSLLQDDDDTEEQSFEHVFAQYASPAATARAHRNQDDAMDGGAPRRPPAPTSKLLQPTQAFLRRVHTQHALREQSLLEGAPLAAKPLRLTRPRSPTLRTTQKAAAARDASDPASRLTRTSRELLQIQQERLQLQLETMRIREFHARSKTQRPPANVHQRSTKQLTVPVSPFLQVGHRPRRYQPAGDAAGDDALPPVIRPETLMSRDFALPATQPHAHPHDPHDVTRPVPPHLHTADRASRRAPSDGLPPEKPSAFNYAAMRVNGVTQPVTPQLLTAKRAHTFRRPVEVVDHDQVELAKKFHAQPVSRRVLEPRPAAGAAAAAASSSKSEKPPLTQPVSPKLSTSARVATRQSAAEKAAAAIADLERRRKERELQRQKARENAGSVARPPPAAAPRGPTIPETPDLKSLRLHRQYQESLRRKIAEEEEQQRRQREFKANPIRLGAGPLLKPEGSTRPLTEVIPFALPGEQFHQRAIERLEAKKRGEDEQLLAQTHFRATPMPVATLDASSHARPSTRPLTKFAAPELASDRRAAERAAFDAAERERRAREEEYRQQAAAEAQQRQEEELKALRREKLVFHARPVPEPRAFAVKPSSKPLTEPHSPALHYHPPSRSGSEASI